jgi:hypothetical protein
MHINGACDGMHLGNSGLYHEVEKKKTFKYLEIFVAQCEWREMNERTSLLSFLVS